VNLLRRISVTAASLTIALVSRFSELVIQSFFELLRIQATSAFKHFGFCFTISFLSSHDCLFGIVPSIQVKYLVLHPCYALFACTRFLFSLSSLTQTVAFLVAIFINQLVSGLFATCSGQVNIPQSE